MERIFWNHYYREMNLYGICIFYVNVSQFNLAMETLITFLYMKLKN
jgi:hypothetical protein